MPKQVDYRVAMLFAIRPDQMGNDYFMPEIRFVKITNDNKIRNFSSWTLDRPDHFLDDLVVDAQGTHKDRAHGLYAFAVQYRNIFAVNYTAATKMVVVLRKIDKGLHKLRQDRGHAKTFGEFVGRVAEVLKVKDVLFYANGSNGMSYDNAEFRYCTVGEGVDTVNYYTAQWQRGEKVSA